MAGPGPETRVRVALPRRGVGGAAAPDPRRRAAGAALRCDTAEARSCSPRQQQPAAAAARGSRSPPLGAMVRHSRRPLRLRLGRRGMTMRRVTGHVTGLVCVSWRKATWRWTVLPFGAPCLVLRMTPRPRGHSRRAGDKATRRRGPGLVEGVPHKAALGRGRGAARAAGLGVCFSGTRIKAARKDRGLGVCFIGTPIRISKAPGDLEGQAGTGKGEPR